MNRYGAMDVGKASGPTLKSLKGETWALKGVRILDVRTEIAAGPGDALIPPAVHPGIPSYGALVVTIAEDSPVGPFVLAELRVGVRVGAIGAFLVVGAICDNEAARAALADNWGFSVAAGQVRLDEFHHRVDARVTAGGRTVLDLGLTDLHALPGTRLSVPSLVNLARHDGKAVLVNAPVSLTYAQANGGRALLRAFDGAAFGAGDNFRPTHPMGAAYGMADLTIEALDLVMDAGRPAEETMAPIAA